MKERDSFGNHFGVLVALAGSAVGLGNLWRFPYLVGTNGGASFILLYLFFVFLICLPLMFTEFVIGRRSQNNVFGAFRTLTHGKKPFWSKIGAISVLCAFVILSFYCVVGGWTINYLVKSVQMQFAEGVDFQQMFEHSSTSTTIPLIYTLVFLFLTALIVIMGVVLGVFVTLSSVGAGAFGIMALVLMFPNLPMIRIIGSDVVHAVLLTLVAGLGYMSSGNVDFNLLMWLLVGSIPAIVVGTLLSSRLPEKIIRKVLGLTLMVIGINFMLNPVKAKPVEKPTSVMVMNVEKNQLG